MIIEKHRIGAHGAKTRYDICNDITETGGDRPEPVASFDKMEIAVLVLRYMRGDTLDATQTYRATEALKKIDAPTD